MLSCCKNNANRSRVSLRSTFNKCIFLSGYLYSLYTHRCNRHHYRCSALCAYLTVKFAVRVTNRLHDNQRCWCFSSWQWQFTGVWTAAHLSDYCVPAAGVDTRQHLRSANRQLFAVPRYRLNTYGRRAFSVAGPTVWNSLPDFIRDQCILFQTFAKKTYLFARY